MTEDTQPTPALKRLAKLDALRLPREEEVRIDLSLAEYLHAQANGTAPGSIPQLRAEKIGSPRQGRGDA